MSFSNFSGERFCFVSMSKTYRRQNLKSQKTVESADFVYLTKRPVTPAPFLQRLESAKNSMFWETHTIPFACISLEPRRSNVRFPLPLPHRTQVAVGLLVSKICGFWVPDFVCVPPWQSWIYWVFIPTTPHEMINSPGYVQKDGTAQTNANKDMQANTSKCM